MEIAELIDSTDWKHWKHTPSDVDNIKIEAIDSLHFVLSMLAEYDVLDIPYMTTSLTEIYNIELPTHFDGAYTRRIADGVIQASYNGSPEYLLTAVFTIAHSVGMSFDEVYKLYVGKGVLNKFRQLNGYKDGSYIKVWDGEEDNVVMQRYVNICTTASPDELYTLLEDRYKGVRGL
jgi:dimeric dUTPase (all-alpha-NTP-PPase superfamily)